MMCDALPLLQLQAGPSYLVNWRREAISMSARWPYCSVTEPDAVRLVQGLRWIPPSRPRRRPMASTAGNAAEHYRRSPAQWRGFQPVAREEEL